MMVFTYTILDNNKIMFIVIFFGGEARLFRGGSFPPPPVDETLAMDH